MFTGRMITGIAHQLNQCFIGGAREMRPSLTPERLPRSNVLDYWLFCHAKEEILNLALGWGTTGFVSSGNCTVLNFLMSARSSSEVTPETRECAASRRLRTISSEQGQ